jgi:8-oxo-dGTP diphosphatase
MKLHKILGPPIFWLSYPIAYLYLRVGIRTRVLIIVDDAILLQKSWLGLDEWGLPGGGVHHGEASLAGAQREVHEETDIQLSAKQLEFMYRDQAQVRGLTFRFDCYSAQLAKRPTQARPMREIAELAWVPLKEVTTENASADTYKLVQAWLDR